VGGEPEWRLAHWGYIMHFQELSDPASFKAQGFMGIADIGCKRSLAYIMLAMSGV
jgi:hypothetical protein